MEATRLPQELQLEIIYTRVYIKNLIPTRSLDKIILYKVQYGRRPDLFYIRIVRYLGYYIISNKTSQTKVDLRVVDYILLGFEGYNLYRVQDIRKNKVVRTSKVLFDKTNFTSVETLLDDVVPDYDINNRSNLDIPTRLY